jgi:hypothetical protein
VSGGPSRSIGLRLARVVALAVIIGIGIVILIQAATAWTLTDAEAYWNAGLRLRNGEPLYPRLGDVDAPDVFRYAPWFAWLAVPWTFLPVQVAGALWSMLLLAGSGIALQPLVRRRAWVAVALFAPILIGISAVGNVQPLLVAALVQGVERRSGPMWVAAAASLKATPILLALVYVGRRQYGRALIALALTAILLAPFLLYDLRGYVTDAGQAAALFAIPALYVVAVAAAIGATWRLARSPYGWLAAGAAAVVALPRLFVYDVTFAMVGAPASARGVSGRAGADQGAGRST